VLARLAEQGYLDDSEFARQLVSHRSGGRGGAAIAAELASKGVARSVAQAAVAEIDPEVEIESGGGIRPALAGAGRARLDAFTARHRRPPPGTPGLRADHR